MMMMMMNNTLQHYDELAKCPPSAGFPSASGGKLPRLRCPRRPFDAAFGGGKRIRKNKFGAPRAPHVSGACDAHSFKNFRRVMRIPNMGLVLKLDNGKMVSIADERMDGQSYPVLY